MKIVKEQKGGLLGMILGTLAANLLENLLAGKGVVRSNDGVIRADEGAIVTSWEQGTNGAGQDF